MVNDVNVVINLLEYAFLSLGFKHYFSDTMVWELYLKQLWKSL